MPRLTNETWTAYREWIGGIPWTHWATLTYRGTPSERSARAWMERWMETVEPARALWVTERGDRFGRVHNHALVCRPQGDLFDSMGWAHGRAEIEPYDSDGGADKYITPYVLKATIDWDIYGFRAI